MLSNHKNIQTKSILMVSCLRINIHIYYIYEVHTVGKESEDQNDEQYIVEY